MNRNHLKTWALFGGLSALVVGLGGLVAPGHLGLFAVLALAMNLGAYFFSDSIVLRMHRAREVSPAEAPELYAMVSELASRAALPMPRVFIVPEAQPNAFATGRTPERGVVAVTEGLLHVLDPRELRGVIAHELAHIKNRDVLVSTMAAAAASIVTFVAHALSWGMFAGGRDEEDAEGGAATGLLVALVAPLAATLIQLGISRSREFLADETGARIAGDAEGLARALEKLDHASHVVPATTTPATASLFIVNPFSAVESVARWFSTHPSTEERVARLLAMRRSAPPAGGRVAMGEW